MSLLLYPLKNYFAQNGYFIAKENWNEPSYAMHFHDCIEITLLTKGTGTQLINGTPHYMPTYSLSIMSLQDCHKFLELSSDNELYNLMISPSILNEAILHKINNLPADKICTLPENVGKTVFSLMDALSYSQGYNQYYSKDFIPAICQSLIDIFLHHYKLLPTLKNKANEAILQNTLAYINTHFTQPITLENIANQANCNPTYLSELFHKKMDMTLKQYINTMRLKYAKRLLSTTDNSIMSICFDSGFSSLASFNRNFLAEEKLSPSAYRKNFATKK